MAFVGFFVLAHLFGDHEPGGTMAGADWLKMIFFPAGVTAGLILGWKSELWGGVVTVGSVVGLHAVYLALYGQMGFIGLIDSFAIPGLLFLLCWHLDRTAA